MFSIRKRTIIANIVAAFVLVVGTVLAGAGTAVAAPATSTSVQPMTACSYNIHHFVVDTGGGLNGRTGLTVCGNGSYVDWLEGWHSNNGSHSHHGRIRLMVINGEVWLGPWVTIAPSDMGTLHLNYWGDLPGRKVCSNWQESDGTVTPGYACANIGS